jgi:hypothetical protein
MGDALPSCSVGLTSRWAVLRAQPANDSEHKITQTVRNFGAGDFRLAAGNGSLAFPLANSRESRRQSAAPTIAMPMIPIKREPSWGIDRHENFVVHSNHGRKI